MADFKFTSNKDEVLREMNRRRQLGLDLVGMECEGFAKKNCPVDTGRLRNSITHATKSKSGGTFSYSDDKGNGFTMDVGQVSEEDCVYIGTSVEYAIMQEFRDDLKHEKRGRAHFLRDALTQHSKRYKSIMEAALSD